MTASRALSAFPLAALRGDQIAMVFQEPLLFDATVFQNVASGLKLRGMEGAKIRQTVADFYNDKCE